MRLAAHGLAIDLPPGWEGRLFRHPGGTPTLHGASFALPARDGDFGSAATARMPPGGTFFALTEYTPGEGLEPGKGIYAPAGPGLPLRPRDFSPRTLLITRAGHVGLQRFFTVARRPLCLYVVHRGRLRDRALGPLNAALGSLRVSPPAGRRGVA